MAYALFKRIDRDEELVGTAVLVRQVESRSLFPSHKAGLVRLFENIGSRA